jgi:hypothetical protein
MEAIGTEKLATYVTDLQEKLKIKQTAQGRIASSLRLINGFFNTSLWLLTVSVF